MEDKSYKKAIDTELLGGKGQKNLLTTTSGTKT